MKNTLYQGDNLRILREYIPDNYIDLVYLDPPFNSNMKYYAIIKNPDGTKAQIPAFEDTWHWTEEIEDIYQEIMETSKDVGNILKTFKVCLQKNMVVYLTMICIRLMELKRVLKDTGSIYLHCDPTASHYLKILMDTIFGCKNFRNEIIWAYSGGGIPNNDFPRKHDVLFRYTKTDTYFYKPIYKEYTKGTKERGRTKVKGNKSLRAEGTPIQDWWVSNLECDKCGHKLAINLKRIASPTDSEKLGYPTQKPEQLLERIIKASSNENDIVLDPFCGCGTTIAVAEESKRKWIGIDNVPLAIELTKQRLQDNYNLEPGKDYNIVESIQN